MVSKWVEGVVASLDQWTQSLQGTKHGDSRDTISHMDDGQPGKRPAPDHCPAVAGHQHLHSDPIEATYKDIIEVFEGCCGDLQLAVTYCFQFKARTQMNN
jgi:hypothetical protein